MTKALYITANKLVPKGGDLQQTARKMQRLFYGYGFDLGVELAQSLSGVITAEIKSDEPFDALEIERILFPKRRSEQVSLYR